MGISDWSSDVCSSDLPGNAWVAEAKRQLYGLVCIDMVAGPSEIVVVADAKNEPHVIAADLLSQAENDSTSQSTLFTGDVVFSSEARSVGQGCVSQCRLWWSSCP